MLSASPVANIDADKSWQWTKIIFIQLPILAGLIWYVLYAIKKGVVLEAGHGEGSYSSKDKSPQNFWSGIGFWILAILLFVWAVILNILNVLK